MKTTIKVEKEVDIKTLLINITPRYIGDSDDDDVPSDMPMLDGGNWIAKVDIDSGIIADWPKGEERNLWAKVCDAGVYVLYDDCDNEIARIAGYVPNQIVPGEYGDYIDLKIDIEGRITNWPSSPDVCEFFNDE